MSTPPGEAVIEINWVCVHSLTMIPAMKGQSSVDVIYVHQGHLLIV